MDAKRFIEIKKAQENSKKMQTRKNQAISDDCNQIRSKDVNCLKVRGYGCK